MIGVHQVTFVYPGATLPALDQINWSIQEGQFALITGPSGSGKSTLLRLLNGLVPHFSGGQIAGNIEVFGVNPIEVGPNEMSHRIGFVSQSPENQVVVDQVEGEIAFPLEQAAVPLDAMRQRVDDVLSMTKLGHLRNRAISSLSGGERQRVAIATALGLQPSMLLLDEPTSQLDPVAAGEVLDLLARLNTDHNLTVVLVEHRLERVLQYADRLSYLEGGRLVVDGPVREAIERIPEVPPLLEIGRKLHWRPLPLTVLEARPFARAMNGRSVVAGKKKGQIQPECRVPPVLQIEGLDFSYNGVPALQSVSLEVRKGEAVALLGNNGSGKTTLLRCVVGLLKNERGEVRIDGQLTEGKSVADIVSRVGYLPQNPDDLLFAPSVVEEMEITLRNHNMTLDPARMDEHLAELGLTMMASRYPRDLSVGQRQRVALGAVTVTLPPLIMLDEPTRGLDAAAKATLVDLWKTWLDKGISLLLVTHDIELVARVADRVALLSQGRIISQGLTSEVLSASSLFAPQLVRLFPEQNWLTINDVLLAMNTEKVEKSDYASVNQNIYT